MTLDKIKEFFTQLFTDLNTEDSIYVIGFLFIAWLLGLLFGRWSRSGKIRRLKRELQAKDKDLIMLRAENGSYKEQLELKEEALQKRKLKLDELNGRVKELEEENSQNRIILGNVRAKLEESQNTASSLSTKNASNLERIDELTKDCTELQHKNEELAALADKNSFESNDVGHLHSTFELTTNRMNALEVKLSRMEKENQKLRQEIGAGGSSLSTASSTSGSHVDPNIGAIKSRLEQLERENNRLQKTLSNMQVVKADLGSSQITPQASSISEEVSPEERTSKARSAVSAAIGSKIKTASADIKDDLKKINGIGPFIEKKLNDIGIYTYEQISQFDTELIAQITDAIQFFPGRINRDDWVGQAKKLMS